MIEAGSEQLISMSEAGHLLAKRLNLAKPPHASSLWRWREKGLLDGLKVAGRLYTSTEAVDRFLNNSNTGKKTPPGRLSSLRQDQIAKAKRRCQAAGV